MPEPTSFLQWLIYAAVAVLTSAKAADVIESLTGWHVAFWRQKRTGQDRLWERIETLEKQMQEVRDERAELRNLYGETKTKAELRAQEIEQLKRQNDTLRRMNEILEEENERQARRLADLERKNHRLQRRASNE